MPAEDPFALVPADGQLVKFWTRSGLSCPQICNYVLQFLKKFSKKHKDCTDTWTQCLWPSDRRGRGAQSKNREQPSLGGSLSPCRVSPQNAMPGEAPLTLRLAAGHLGKVWDLTLPDPSAHLQKCHKTFVSEIFQDVHRFGAETKHILEPPWSRCGPPWQIFELWTNGVAAYREHTHRQLPVFYRIAEFPGTAQAVF